MLVSYPAIFYYNESEPAPFFVSFPDFDGAGTQGENIPDAMRMASEWLGITVAGYIEYNRSVPKPSNIKDLSPSKNNPVPEELVYDAEESFVSMVLVDLSDYLNSDRPVKKTLTIPYWADQLGKKLKINFSQTLTDAIVEKQLE